MVITMNIMAICHNMGTPKYAFLGKKDEPAWRTIYHDFAIITVVCEKWR
jgi:hypothetical protein